MVKQYPHNCRWVTSYFTGYDQNGFPISLENGVMESNCRYEAFKKGDFKQITTTDGKVIQATGALYFKRGVPFPERFKVVHIQELDISLDVVHSYKGQLNSTSYTVEL